MSIEKFWENETPITFKTSKNTVSLFREANKLTISRPDWLATDGTQRQGKTVSMDLVALVESDTDTRREAHKILTFILLQIEKGLINNGTTE